MNRHLHILTRRERGATAVEFALCSLLLFTFIFGTIEVARALFLWNTLATITARGARSAALVDFNDTAGKTAALINALSIAGPDDTMFLAPEITHANLVIDYLRADGTTRIDPPPCPARNVANCMANPMGGDCVQFVRVRLCKQGTACDNVPYAPLFGLPGLDALKVDMPWFAAVVPVESAGMPGACT